MSLSLAEKSKLVKKHAHELGFDYCGISKADFLKEHAPRVEKWLSEGKHGQMDWMENHFDKRLDPRKLFPGTKSVISVLLNYYPNEKQSDEGYRVAKYAYGRDYHKVIKKKLFRLIEHIQAEFGQVQARAFVDSAPVMDRVWAQKSGLGWIGKNTLLINKKSGSFFLIGEILIDLEFEYDLPIKDYCGTCRRCIDACPTQAISQYEVNGSKCISYYTIELKESIPADAKWNDWIFGCDICQDVCPWNRLSKPTIIDDFKIKEATKQFSKQDWEEITETAFEKAFAGTPLKRAGYEGIKRNIAHLTDQK